MQHRKPTGGGNGRPSGTDGSDFSYRMVVDSRYTKVTKGKSRLSALILSQAISGSWLLLIKDTHKIYEYLIIYGILCENLIAFREAIVQLLGSLNFLPSIQKQESLDPLAVSSTVIGFLSILIGELGRRRSRVNLLKFYMFASSIAVLISFARAGRSNFLLEVIQDTSQWKTNKFELIKIVPVLLGLLLQIVSINTTISLISNMSPPKRAS